jgi:two-component sensor histidine kinase
MSDPRDARSEGAAPATSTGAQRSLLQEVDHRVKNNLQLIASMILLQSRRAPDPVARQALKTVLERVTAVATVHRRLFQDDPLNFEAADFLRDLASDMAAAAGRDDLQISLELDRVTLPASSAAAFALVANELIGNALKHAFPAGRTGRVTVGLANGGGVCVFSVADDGMGAAQGTPGFGSTIVKLLCQQLHAELQVSDAEPGTRATVTLPVGQGRA